MESDVNKKYIEKTDESKLKKIKIKNFLKIVIIIVLCICIAGGILYLLFGGKKENIITSSTLLKTLDRESLYTAEYSYEGIAKINQNNDDYYIKYETKVKAGIEKVSDIEIIKMPSEEDKTLVLKLPEIILEPQLVYSQENETSFSYIPNQQYKKVDLPINDIIELCKNDAKEEVKESKELYKMAKENLENTIRAFLYPILLPQFGECNIKFE